MPFDDAGRPLLWLAPEVMRPVCESGTGQVGSLSAWVSSGAWNLGAERLWIGPEIDFMVADRRDFAGSYSLPVTMDPGAWRVDRDGSGAALPLRFRHEMSMVAHQQRAPLSIAVSQTLAPAADPLRVGSMPADPLGATDPLRTDPQTADQGSRRLGSLRHLGWTREVTLNRAADDPGRAACQAWVLIQADVGATVVVPGAARARVTDYFEPVDRDHLRRDGEDLALRLSGSTRYKVGVRSGEHRGTVAYWRDFPDGTAVLLLRSFADTPSTRYLEQPPEQPDHEGDSVYVYNDDGRYGAFGEVEVLGRALEPEMASVTDTFTLHAWWGERNDVAEAAAALLGRQLPRMLFI